MSFPIGTLCLIVSADEDFCHVGMQCVTTSQLQGWTTQYPVSGMVKEITGYEVEVQGDPDRWVYRPEQLIKIDPEPEQFDETEEREKLTPSDKKDVRVFEMIENR